ncbi:MAG TPA: long-chain fatty acid--CoA ligase [Bacteroidetes bacterium]|nr:long-chain fatty acid--CoA ligase [Bacteroidota bacterium]
MSELITKLESVVAEHADQPALVFREHTVTYARFSEAVNRLARALVDLGVQRGDRVALMLPNIVQFPVAYYAILRAGAAVVPINITYKQNELRYILEDSEAKGIIAWEGFVSTVVAAVDSLDQCSVEIFLGDRIPSGAHSYVRLQEKSEPLAEPVETSDEDVAVILYTAGTTGRPMGAELTHSSLKASAEILWDQFRFQSGDRHLAALPLYHAFGQAVTMNAPLLTGGCVVLEPKFDPAHVLESLQQHEVRWLAAVPTMLAQLLEAADDETELPNLRYCITSGAPIAEELVTGFEERFGARVLPGYGLTETFSLVACTRLDRDWRPGSVGQPLYGIEVAVFSEADEFLRPGKVGEVVVKGPTVLRDYLNRPKATEEVLRNGWLHTGDIGYLDDEGYLFLVDRKKDVIIKGGFSIFPSEIEQCLLGHPAVERAVVIGVPDPKQGEEVKAYVVLREGAKVSAEELINYCRDRMALYKCPRYIAFCDEVPRSTTGRILKRMLRERELSALEEK